MIPDASAADRMPSATLTKALKRAGTAVHFARGDMICPTGEKAPFVHVVASGLVAAIKGTSDGLNEIVALYLPGNIVELDLVSLGISGSDYVALTASAAFRVAISTLRDVIASDPALAAAYMRHVATQMAVAHEWLYNIGRRQSVARTAHFLCEFMYRCGLREPAGTLIFPLPFTQIELANTLGLSVVHVNRVLMRLRERGLIKLGRGHIEALDWPGLQDIAGFDPSYIHSDA